MYNKCVINNDVGCILLEKKSLISENFYEGEVYVFVSNYYRI